VHPAVVDAYMEGRLDGARGEAAVIALLARKKKRPSLATALARSIRSNAARAAAARTTALPAR
jgi:hypothetical protein